jgi:hypothetical protein
VTPGHAGYSVTYERDGSHRPIVFDDGALTIFGFGERVPDGAYPGSIRVAVGTPALGAAVSGRSGVRYVFGTTLAELLRTFLRQEEHVPVAKSGTSVDASAAMILDFQGETVADEQWSVGLIAHGGRTFVVTATGFETLYPTESAPARRGLLAFLADFQFTTPLFWSRQLGFEVPLPVAAEPDVGIAGSVVFADGEQSPDGAWSHAISVSVGSRMERAVAQVLAGPGPSRGERIWAPSLVELQAVYATAIGGRTGSSTTIELDGELALLVDRPNGLAATVLAVHAGRVYIISTTGFALREHSPGFEAFLEAFTFLGVAP